jgi:hypothetical protein
MMNCYWRARRRPSARRRRDGTSSVCLGVSANSERLLKTIANKGNRKNNEYHLLYALSFLFADAFDSLE